MNIKLGFLLMLVGMLTVFCILLIIIYGSRWLISAMNRFSKDEPVPVKVAQEDNTKAVIEAVVAKLTGGKGQVTKINSI